MNPYLAHLRLFLTLTTAPLALAQQPNVADPSAPKEQQEQEQAQAQGQTQASGEKDNLSPADKALIKKLEALEYKTGTIPLPAASATLNLKEGWRYLNRTDRFDR